MGMSKAANSAKVAVGNLIHENHELRKEMKEIKEKTSDFINMNDAKKAVLDDIYKGYAIGQPVWFVTSETIYEECSTCKGKGKFFIGEDSNLEVKCPKCNNGNIGKSKYVPKVAGIRSLILTHTEANEPKLSFELKGVNYGCSKRIFQLKEITRDKKEAMKLAEKENAKLEKK